MYIWCIILNILNILYYTYNRLCNRNFPASFSMEHSGARQWVEHKKGIINTEKKEFSITLICNT